jgi:hypothetical protein
LPTEEDKIRTRKSEETSISEPERNNEAKQETQRRVETASFKNRLIRRKEGSLWREETKNRGRGGKE